MAEVEGSEITYQRALVEQMRIPPYLQGLIADVMFVEPPELMGSCVNAPNDSAGPE
jgi:hypothetical protein